MTFTYEDVIEAAREVVAEKGADYNYRVDHGSCKYAEPDGSPSCIVGHVVAKLDPEAFAKLVADEKITKNSVSASLIPVVIRNQFFWDDEAKAAMSFAQQVQDDGHPWGTALREAESVRIPA